MADLLKKINEVSSNLQGNEKVKNSHDAMVLALHCCMLQEGFRCVGLAEKGPNQEPTEPTQLLPSGWNSNSDAYSFKYRHIQSSMTYVLKCLTLGDTLIVHAMALEDKKPYNIEFDINDFKKSDKFENSDQFYKDISKLQANFISNILRKLFPKEGYEASNPAANIPQQNQNQQQPPNNNDRRNYVPPPQPNIPDYEDYDPLRIGPVRRPNQGGIPYGIGGDDLYPGGFGPRPFFPGNNGGGMNVGPNHPGFGPGVNNPYYNNPFNNNNPYGLPRGAVPPGARFDPFTPPNINPNPNSYPNNNRPRPNNGNRGPPNFPGEPDRDEFMPPGDENPYWM